MKQLKTISLLVLLLIMGQDVLASNPPFPGVGVVVKKNPGGGASRATTDNAGNFSLELVKGSYLISLDKNQLLTAGQLLVAAQNPKSNYVFNGDGTQLAISENENIIMSQLEGDAGTDLLLITAIKPTTLQGTVQWDSSVMENPKPTSSSYVGHVTLLRKNATSFVTQVFCPTGTVGLRGKCVPIKELENSAAYVGHVTLLRKNAASTISIKPTNGVCPDGYTLKDGICVLATNASELQAQTEGGPIAGTVIASGGHNGKVKTEGQPVRGQIVKGGQNGKVKRNGHVTLMRFTQIYLGGGIFSPTQTTKEAGMVSGIDINLGVYQPIWNWETTSLGLNLGGSYTTGNGDYQLDNRYTVYQLQGQSAPPVVAEKGTGSPKQQGFKFEAGPQMNIHLGDVTVSPIFNVGYLSVTQKEFTVTETVQEQTVDYPYVLLTQKETKTNGLAMIPKVRLAYNFTPRIGIWMEGSYILGPKTATESTRFVLDPNIPSDSYNLGHFQEGQYITTKSETKYSGIGISGGIVIGLGKRTGTTRKGGTVTTPTASGYHIQEFNEGCTRTCTGDWSVNASSTVYTCDGTAGPLICDKGMGNTETTSGLSVIDYKFDKNGEVSLKKIQAFCHWGLHWGKDGMGGCRPKGAYCIERWVKEMNSLQSDETIGDMTIDLKENNINILIVGTSGNLSKELKKQFNDKKVELPEATLPPSVIEELFKTIKLNMPKENITFKTSEQRYDINNTTNNGKPVQIIEVLQKTKIKIDSKEYNLTVITTSGRGSGSPKQAGF